MQTAFSEAAAAHAEIALHQTQAAAVNDSTKKKFPEQLRNVATPTHGILEPAKALHAEGPAEDLRNKTRREDGGKQMPALEENASAFPLSEPLRLPNPRAHEQSPDHRHQHEVFTTQIPHNR